MTQRHVVPADIAEQMFPFSESYSDGSHSRIDQPATVRWLVGPIDCAECEGHGEITYPEWEGEFERCRDCDGLGYPPAIEIVSEHPIGGYPPHLGVVTDVRPHGVVKLGKPVPIVSMSQATADDYTEDVFILAPVGNGTRPVRVDRTAGVEYVMSNIGPCSPGDVAYPIEVAS